MAIISVIVPVYKVEELLPQCVDSILNQTFRDFELWLVDDGSPDRCGEMCDEYAAKDARIRVIHKPNGGLSDARNAALDKVTGEYITFVDSDDWLPPDSFQTMYDALVKNGADVAVGNMLSVTDEGEEGKFYWPAEKETVLTGDDVFQTFCQPCAPNRLYRAEIFKELRYPVGRLYEDVFIYHNVLDHVNKLVFTGRLNYYYRLRSGSIMRSAYSIRFTDIIDAVMERVKWLEGKGQTLLANEARLFIYSRVAVAFAHLDKKVEKEAKRLDEVFAIYKECYSKMMQDRTIGIKQKARLWLLRYCPALHSRLFGKRMPLALG